MSSFAPDLNKYQGQSFTNYTYTAAPSFAPTAPFATSPRTNQPPSLGSTTGRASAPQAANSNSAGPTAPSGFAVSKDATTTRRTNGNGGTQAVSKERYYAEMHECVARGKKSKMQSDDKHPSQHFQHPVNKRLFRKQALSPEEVDTMWYRTRNLEWHEYLHTEMYEERTETTFEKLLRGKLELREDEKPLTPTVKVAHFRSILNHRFHMVCGTKKDEFLPQWFAQNAEKLRNQYKEEQQLQRKKQQRKQQQQQQQLSGPASASARQDFGPCFFRFLKAGGTRFTDVMVKTDLMDECEEEFTGKDVLEIAFDRANKQRSGVFQISEEERVKMASKKAKLFFTMVDGPQFDGKFFKSLKQDALLSHFTADRTRVLFDVAVLDNVQGQPVDDLDSLLH